MESEITATGRAPASQRNVSPSRESSDSRLLYGKTASGISVASYEQRFLDWQRALTVVAVLLAIAGVCRTEEPSSLGAIEGIVSYQADPARPWRYARYYVKQAKSGELAEAVVAIRAKPV